MRLLANRALCCARALARRGQKQRGSCRGIGLLVAALLAGAVGASSPADAESRKLYLPVGSERLLSFDLPFGQISVADPSIIEAVPFTRQKLNLIAKSFGSTFVLVMGEDGLTNLASYDVQVGPNLAELKQSLWRLAPGAQIELNFVNTSLQIQGTVPDSKTAELIISAAEEMTGTKPISALQIKPNASLIEDALKRLVPNAEVQVEYVDSSVHMRGRAPDETSKALLIAAVASITGLEPVANISVDNAQQVTLKVRIVEVSRSLKGALGGGLDIGDGSEGSGKDYVNSTSSSISWLELASDLIAGLSIISPNINIDLYLKVLEEQGYAKFLAEPTLTALSGEEASFLAGGEVPFEVLDSSGKLTVIMKEIGTRLNFKPTVKPDGKINLVLTPEVSRLDSVNQYNGKDIFQVRRATTTVELENNQTLVIAGLHQDNKSRNKTQTPALGNIKFLGGLFRKSELENENTQVLFVITPSYDSQHKAQERAMAQLRASLPTGAKDFFYDGFVERGYDVNDMAQGVGILGRFGACCRIVHSALDQRLTA